MFELFVAVGAKVPMPHYHESFDEIVYGLKRIITFTEMENWQKSSPG